MGKRKCQNVICCGTWLNLKKKRKKKKERKRSARGETNSSIIPHHS
jgi:hypothetical protein